MENALIRITDLKQLIKDTDIPIKETATQTRIENELKIWENKIKHKKIDEINSFNEWMDNAHAWFMSFHDTPLSTIVISQIAFFIVKSLFAYTPLYPISYIYDFSLVSMLSVQGELWENGIGRFINLTDNSYLIKSALLMLSLFSLISYSLIKESTYDTFLITVFIIIFFINSFMPKFIYYLIKLMKDTIESNQNPYEARYSSYKYGHHFIHIPIITILFSIIAGYIGLNITGFIQPSTYTELSFKQAIGPFE